MTTAGKAPPIGARQAPAAVIDRGYLERFTLGNIALEQEVLQLFAAQVPHYLDRLRQAATDADWKAAAHTLKGSAAAIGAQALAHFAELAEQVDLSLAPAARQAERELAERRIAEATEATCRHIGHLLGH
jgi:HPt (histidine-containing phosphotransfer) domain-containing protein